MKLRLSELEFSFQKEFKGAIPEAYERLLLDALVDDASLFARADEVELAWGIIDPILAAWRDQKQPAMIEYEKSLWGPTQATPWMEAQGREWFDTCPVLG
jgi:glucose-6-phosphate 1-dehydrogenase